MRPIYTMGNVAQVLEVLKVHSLTEKFLPFYTTKVPAGVPYPGDEHKDGFIDLNKHLLKNPESSFCVRVDGDSMIEVGIYPGDLLIVDCSVPPTSGRVVVAVVNGELTVKRLIKQQKKLLLVPENSHYVPIEINADTSFTILGVVVSSIHPL